MRNGRSGGWGLALGVALATASASVAFAQSGGWQVFDNTTSASGSPTYAAILKADNTVSGSLDEPKAPTLAVTCDHAGLAFTIIWPDLLDRSPAQSWVTIQWRLDDGAPQESAWPASARSVAESGGQALDWASRWAAGATLTVHVPDQHGGQDATFEVTGLSDIVGRVRSMSCGG
jgi:hypothetical protein